MKNNKLMHTRQALFLMRASYELSKIFHLPLFYKSILAYLVEKLSTLLFEKTNNAVSVWAFHQVDE